MLFTRRDALATLLFLGKGAFARDFPRKLSYVNSTIGVSENSTSISLPAGTGVPAPINSTTSLPVVVLNSTINLVTATPTGTGLPPFANTTSSGLLPPFANTTSIAGVGLTTLTVSATSISTIISCAATVTNCPAATDTSALTLLPNGAVSTILVTSVVDLTTIVCPVTEVTAISSSVIASFSATASLPAITSSTLVAGDASSTAAIGTTGGSDTGANVPDVTTSVAEAGATTSLETSAVVSKSVETASTAPGEIATVTVGSGNGNGSDEIGTTPVVLPTVTVSAPQSVITETVGGGGVTTTVFETVGGDAVTRVSTVISVVTTTMVSTVLPEGMCACPSAAFGA